MRENLPELWFVIELGEKTNSTWKVCFAGLVVEFDYVYGIDSVGKFLIKPLQHGVSGAGSR